MGLGSLIFQVAVLVTIIVLKAAFAAENFAVLITQIAWASILGSVATFRLEFLLLQQNGRVTRPDLLLVFTVATGFLLMSGGVINGSAMALGANMPLMASSLLLALGIGLQEAQSLLCVKLQKIPALLMTRALQASGLVCTALTGWYGGALSTVFGLYATSVTLPLLLWFARFSWRLEGPNRIDWPAPRLLWRGLALALSTFANAVYANGAVIIAAATQNANFVADFGFIMRLLTGPITTIRQAFAHSYNAQSIVIDKSDATAHLRLWDITKQVILRSLTAYVVIQIGVIGLLFATADFFNIARPALILWLVFATMAQVCVNAVSGVRTALEKEALFMRFDILRVTILITALLLPLGLPFYIVFATVSAGLYLSYIAFIRWQIFALRPSD